MRKKTAVCILTATAALAAAVAIADASQAAEPPAPATQLTAVVTTSIVIDRPASVVWPVLRDVARWMPGVSRKIVRGEPDKVGEVIAHSHSEGDGPVPPRLEEILLIEPGRRLVLGMSDAKTGIHSGFDIDQRLFESKGRTTVEFTLLWTINLPESMTFAQLNESRAKMSAELVALLDTHLARLKAAAET